MLLEVPLRPQPTIYLLGLGQLQDLVLLPPPATYLPGWGQRQDLVPQPHPTTFRAGCLLTLSELAVVIQLLVSGVQVASVF